MDEKEKIILDTFDLNSRVFKLLEKLLRRIVDVSKE